MEHCFGGSTWWSVEAHFFFPFAPPLSIASFHPNTRGPPPTPQPPPPPPPPARPKGRRRRKNNERITKNGVTFVLLHREGPPPGEMKWRKRISCNEWSEQQQTPRWWWRPRYLYYYYHAKKQAMLLPALNRESSSARINLCRQKNIL